MTKPEKTNITRDSASWIIMRDWCDAMSVNDEEAKLSALNTFARLHGVTDIDLLGNDTFYTFRRRMLREFMVREFNHLMSP